MQEQAARLAEEQFSEQLNAQEVDREALAQSLESMPEEWRRANWLQSEVTRISRQIDSLGSVNLAALDELTTSRERKEFLDAQQQDLMTAIETLEDAIRKIDRETRELLQETFNTVNGHFGELFPRAVRRRRGQADDDRRRDPGRGRAGDGAAPGQAQQHHPPVVGRRKGPDRNGPGVRVFKLNPAPFCLLDEVDAPLDDANTERYANLVSAMSEQTQFLFISHNKIAMQMAKQLSRRYGCGTGVSCIVAVDIDSAVQLAAEAA